MNMNSDLYAAHTFTICGRGLELKTTLDEKWRSKPFHQASARGSKRQAVACNRQGDHSPPLAASRWCSSLSSASTT